MGLEKVWGGFCLRLLIRNHPKRIPRLAPRIHGILRKYPVDTLGYPWKLCGYPVCIPLRGIRLSPAHPYKPLAIQQLRFQLAWFQ